MVVLAGELLREAEKLVSQNIHPMTIISGKPSMGRHTIAYLAFSLSYWFASAAVML